MIRPLVTLLLCAALAACATAPHQQTQSGAPQQVSLPPPPRPGEPGDIADMREAQLRATFGTPALVRKDGHTEMLRYDGASCKAFFFLYPAGDSFAVRHVETVPRGHEIAADFDCLNALRAHPGTTPVS